MLAALAAFALGAAATEVWSRSRPEPLEPALVSAGECFPVGESEVATYGTMTLTNRSDKPVKIIDLRLVGARGTLPTGASYLVPMATEPVGNQPGFPPTRNLGAPGLRWTEQRLAIRGFVQPSAEAGTMNLVLGVRLIPGTANPSFERVDVTYESGRRTYVWHSAGPVTMSTTGVAC